MNTPIYASQAATSTPIFANEIIERLWTLLLPTYIDMCKMHTLPGVNHFTLITSPHKVLKNNCEYHFIPKDNYLYKEMGYDSNNLAKDCDYDKNMIVCLYVKGATEERSIYNIISIPREYPETHSESELIAIHGETQEPNNVGGAPV